MKKIQWRQEKARWELDYRRVNKILCSLEVGMPSRDITSQRCVNLDIQGQLTGLA